MPGCWDPFELAVQAMLGRDMLVTTRTPSIERIANAFGTAIPAREGLARLFPTPAQLADAPLEHAGLPATKVRAIRSLARAASRDDLDPLDTTGLDAMIADYIAMRADGEPDAFPCGAVMLRQIVGATASDVLARSQSWRPWRAYAAMLLWHDRRARRQIKRRA